MSPPRQRSKVNKDPAQGRYNRQRGMCSKAHAFAKLYNVDIVVAIKWPDGRLGGYQSQPGLAHTLLRRTEPGLIGPPEVESWSTKDTRRHMNDTKDRGPSGNTMSSESLPGVQTPASCLSSMSNSSLPMSSASPPLPPSSVSAVSVASSSSHFDTVDETSRLQRWAGDLALPPAILFSDPVYSAGQIEPQLQQPYSTVCPAAIENTPERASAILQPVPVSAGQRKAILRLLGSYL